MKKYYISMDLGEGVPIYDFVINAENEDEGKRIANDILWSNYPEEMSLQGNDKGETEEAFWITEITAEELLERMTIN